MAVGFQDPHHPHCVPTDYANRVDPLKVPLPDFDEGELDDKPPHFGLVRTGDIGTSRFKGEYAMAGQGPGEDFRNVTPDEASLGRAYYYTMVQLIDDQMGRILESLDEQGLAENTIVIFTTDHGELLGDHGIWMKGPMHYEQVVRIPMIIRWPQEIEGGREVSALANQVDITPTILEAIGIKSDDDFDGNSLMGVLTGKKEKASDYVFVECVDDPQLLRLKTIISDKHKLTWYCENDFGELYDLSSDPTEKINLWDDEKHATIKAKLLCRLLDHAFSLEKRAQRIAYA